MNAHGHIVLHFEISEPTLYFIIRFKENSSMAQIQPHVSFHLLLTAAQSVLY